MANFLHPVQDITNNALLNKRLDRYSEFCYHCEAAFNEKESKIAFNTRHWHQQCFVCAQCLQPLETDEVFLNNDRMYCKHDYKMLFAPVCRKCNNFILQGRVIKAIDSSWHADCFTCTICDNSLDQFSTFKKKDGLPYCPNCYETVKGEGFICFKCKGKIAQNEYVKVDGEFYHPFHFHCKNCNNELDKNFREKEKELYCLRCFDKFGIAICATCRRPVEERVINALGKKYHVEHFVCAFCSKPFLGTHYYIHEGAAYCETHYQMVHRNVCCYCRRDTGMDTVKFLDKTYCLEHFACFACDLKLDPASKIYKLDRKPICKICLQKLPNHLRKRLAALHKYEYKNSENLK